MVQEGDALTEIFEPGVECRGIQLLEQSAHGHRNGSVDLVGSGLSNSRGPGHRQGDNRQGSSAQC